jgi:peptidoglycan/LPS O-acetylase OafA/YrhL
MGIIRLLLAISVVLFHTGINPIWTGTGGTASVQAFYMISGFYIAMILRGNYRGALMRFWANRALRLFPAYIVVMVLTLALRLAFSPDLIQMFRDLPTSAKAVVVLTNSFVFGQDWVMFLGIHNHELRFVSDYRNSTPQLWMFMLDPPAWSLGIELTFYLIAPFLFRLRLSLLLGAMLLSILLRVILVGNGLSFDPWSYRFFPTEIALFIAGALAQIASAPLRGSLPKIFRYGPIATALIIALIVLFPFLPGSIAAKSIALYVTLAICLPIIFESAKSNKTDRYIGDLSYELYISHWTVVLVMHRAFGTAHTFLATLSILLMSLASAIILGIAIDFPLRRLRARVRESAKRESTAKVEVGVNPVTAN